MCGPFLISCFRNCTMIKSIALLLGYIALQILAAKVDNENTLILTHIIYRHGDRTPDYDVKIPNNPHENETFFPYGPGQLTLDGKRRAFNLGVKLRKRYSDFLGPLYYIDLIEGISSSYPRCVMSMQSALTALFPPDSSTEISLGLDWQPVYFEAPSPNEDRLIRPTCEKILDYVFHADEETSAFYQFVSENLGVHFTKPHEIATIQNTYQVLEEQGFDLPEWVSSVWPEPFRRHGLKIWKLIADQTTPYVIGNLLKKINEDSLQAVHGTDLKNRKMFMYSGHDLNVVAYLGAVGLYEESLYVDYSACIMVEIHAIDGVFGVKVFFDNSDGKGPQLLKIPACGFQEFCPLETYIELTSEKYGPEEWCT